MLSSNMLLHSSLLLLTMARLLVRAEVLAGLQLMGAHAFVEQVDKAGLEKELEESDFVVVLAFNDQAWENFTQEKDEAFRMILEEDRDVLANLLRGHWLFDEEHLKDFITLTNNHSIAIVEDRDEETNLAGAKIEKVRLVKNGALYVIDRVLFPTAPAPFLSSSSSSKLSSLEVETKQGTVKGVQLEDDHVAWLGIPYAKPPSGDLRFKPPEAPEPWVSVLETSKPPAACMQARGEFFGDFEGSQMWNPNTDISEDCLYLNVHRASNDNTEDKLLPVLVWIYGGGFMTGSSVLDIYNPIQLVNKGRIVYVTMQYRVGVHGFLSFGPDSSAPGNVGLLDQVKALEWVRDNIESFGGDPNDVTLMGESAGAQSIAIHLVSPLSQNLFNKAILQSSGLNTRWGFVEPELALKRAKKMAETVDCGSSEDNEALIECLREKDAQQLVDNEYSVEEYTINLFPFVATVDGTMIDQSMEKLVERLQDVEKPLLIGTNANEGFRSLMYFLTDVYRNEELSDQQRNMTKKEYQQNVKAIFPFYSDAVNQLIAHEHEFIFPCTDVDRYFKTLDQIVARSDFVCNTEHFASAIALNGNKNVYRYHFEHQSSLDSWPSWSGSKHGDELEFVFGHPLSKPEKYTDDEIDLAADINVYWTNFVVTGNPNGESGLDAWPAYSAPSWPYLNLTSVANGGRVQQQVMRDQCQFWNEILPLFNTN